MNYKTKYLFENKIYENDVIVITDKDILNAMAFTLYEKEYNEVLKENEKERDILIDELLEEILLLTKGKATKTSFSTKGFTFWKQDTLSFILEKFNHYKPSMFITDTFRVVKTDKNYFKIGILSRYHEHEFDRVGKLEIILEFLNGLKFPYSWQYKKFYKLGCSFK